MFWTRQKALLLIFWCPHYFKLEITQEITSSFSERRFLESKNQAVKNDSYNFQTSNTWHKSSWHAGKPSSPLWAWTGPGSRRKINHKPGNKLAFCLLLDHRMGSIVVWKCGTEALPHGVRKGQISWPKREAKELSCSHSFWLPAHVKKNPAQSGLDYWGTDAGEAFSPCLLFSRPPLPQKLQGEDTYCDALLQ